MKKTNPRKNNNQISYLIRVGLHEGVSLVDKVGPGCPLGHCVPCHWLLHLQRHVEASVGHKLWCQRVEDVVLGHLHTVQGGSQLRPGDAQQALVLVARLQEVLPHFPVRTHVKGELVRLCRSECRFTGLATKAARAEKSNVQIFFCFAQ